MFELLDLSPGLLREPDRHDVAIETLQRHAEGGGRSGARRARPGKPAPGRPLVAGSVLKLGRQAELSRQLGEYKAFLERLRVFNNPGRLRNLLHGDPEVRGQTVHRALRALERLSEALAALQPLKARFACAGRKPCCQSIIRWSAVSRTRANQLQGLRHGAGVEDAKR